VQLWEARMVSSELGCFASFLSTLTTWRDLIANYFLTRPISGFVKGVNNKLKSIKNRCYGLNNLDRCFRHITFNLASKC
jgi:transposase